ncbi:MAG: SDR family oxidoreductase [Actinobacteria bacterium]|nr:SDR family oxidoreductase [Actinomycetota bacterium]
MSLFDAYRYDGRRAVVAGGATGMGAAVVDVLLDAGAEVIAMDRAEITRDGVTAVSLDLSDKASIEAAVDGLDGPVDALFSCAGVADGTPGLERINFIGHRHMIDRMVDKELLGRGSAIGMISSAAGFGWEENLHNVEQYLAVRDFDEATAWAQEHGRTDYLWSKLTVNAFVAQEAMPLLKKGIRINATLPGPTTTPLAKANADTWLTFAEDYRAEVGIEASTPLEQAYPLVFLCSPAASGITGITVVSDAGYFSSGTSKAYQPAVDAVGFMRMEF